MEKRAFIVEDEENIRELIKCTLEPCGLTVFGFENALLMFKELELSHPDIIILDIMLPQMDGLEALKKLKANPKTVLIPVILLTAKSSEIDKVTGLDLGADDYVTKPFGILEMMARVRAVLRKNSPVEEKVDIYDQKGIILDSGRHEVYVGGLKVDLTLKEFALLKLLMENAGKVITRNILLDKVWGYGYAGETRTLDMHIRSLRLKLHDNADEGGFIATVRGVGYKFNS
jgi:two-component system alkaline phosphatase synthesis response regulator PhoP